VVYLYSNDPTPFRKENLNFITSQLENATKQNDPRLATVFVPSSLKVGVGIGAGMPGAITLGAAGVTGALYWRKKKRM